MGGAQETTNLTEQPFLFHADPVVSLFKACKFCAINDNTVSVIQAKKILYRFQTLTFEKNEV